MASTELGHHQKRVYIDHDGHLIVPSSAAIKVEAGGIMAVKPSTGGLSAIYATQVSNALSNRGVSVIRTTDATGVDTVAQPTKETIGMTKTIVIDTTAKRKIRLATAAGSRDVKCGTTSASVIVTTSELGKLAHKGGGVTCAGMVYIALTAASTDRWLLTGINPAFSTNFTKYWVFSSCT